MWPAELDTLPGDDKYRAVSRQDLFRIADRAAAAADPASAAQLHVAVIAWGAGDSAQRVVRALFPLQEQGAPEKLAKALHVVRSQGALSGYRAMHKRGGLEINRLAAGFFTKYLHFGYDAKPAVGRPLIYDSRVVAALNKLDDQEWFENGPSEMNARYIDLAADWARDFETLPDVIERRLFDLGASQ
ncbi:8-oxoguanine DNA glycosylase OGG fold protein [Gordonia terrae]